ncbi:hypothetical protein R1sor_019081 [Riccia sorocarpa]|uniref:Uncharacterized protein n=1 Tax=Riccia sorocarpa TaxID=122646 RepID=A0ABD3IHQ8_9MARC
MTQSQGTNGTVDSETEILEEGRALAAVLPRVLVVSRRTVRKNKFVDFVGEYHLDLIVKYGAVPVIVPRVSGLHSLLDSFEPIHGVLLCEGEDIDPSLYESDLSHLTPEDIAKIKSSHVSDTQIDKDKDSIELQLARRCLERNIPYLGICRGSQVLNVACGGSLYLDVETELSSKKGVEIHHIDYNNYDAHRHPVTVIEGTPLQEWFADSLRRSPTGSELIVNSYHHQGVKRLAARFQPMAYAPDGLVEAFYDPAVSDPGEGKFIMGLQFHPERMRHEQDIPLEKQTREQLTQGSTFDYPECPRVYQEFVKAVVAYQKKLLSREKEMKAPKIAAEVLEKKRAQLERSFSFARDKFEEGRNQSIHGGGRALAALKEQSGLPGAEKELEVGAKFLQSNTALTSRQVKFLHAMGATVRNSSMFLEKMQMNERKEAEARKMMEGMEERELQEFIDFYRMMIDAASSVLQQRRNSNSSRNF